MAYLTHGYTPAETARRPALHYATIGKAVRAADQAGNWQCKT